jgi:hypothetical protein
MLKPVTLSQCLLDAFANSDYYPSQDRRQMWAIREGLGRVDPWRDKWRAVSARKQHQCERGCPIENGHTYFQRAHGAGWGFGRILAGFWQAHSTLPVRIGWVAFSARRLLEGSLWKDRFCLLIMTTQRTEAHV